MCLQPDPHLSPSRSATRVRRAVRLTTALATLWASVASASAADVDPQLLGRWPESTVRAPRRMAMAGSMAYVVGSERLEIPVSRPGRCRSWISRIRRAPASWGRRS